MTMKRSLPVMLLALAASAQQPATDLDAILARPILGLSQPMFEVRVYTASRVPVLPAFSDAGEWQRYAGRLRQQVLDQVILRGVPAAWRQGEARVEWVETLPGEGYRVRKLRYEAVPGLWVPALLYEPAQPSGRVPVVLNVNGHEKTGNSTPYIQARCINLARRGMLAMNVEWFGRGQLATTGFQHYKINQLDLCGTSGVALHYLSMQRALDLLLAHPNADRDRVAVTGLSGGGWQTILLSALDPRVRLADPVAGYSSFVTRAQFPELDLGDSEQTPSDLATVADYTHLTALLAPRPALLTYNSRDTCCFRADYAVAPLLQAALPVYGLFGAASLLRHHINYDPGHNYERDNREAFYRMLRDHFYAGSASFSVADLAVDTVRTDAQLAVPLPEDNLDFQKIALALSRTLPRETVVPSGDALARWQPQARSRLERIVRVRRFRVDAEEAGSQRRGDAMVRSWRLRMDDWTVPAVEIAPANARSTAILVADRGRASVAAQVERLLAGGSRVLAVDPFYFGESKIEKRDFLFALLVAAVGDRPLGLQAGQVAAIARWLHEQHPGEAPSVVAVGPRSSLFALVAAALEPRAIGSLELHGSMASLKEVIEQGQSADQVPELFCFGLLEAFDVPQLIAMVAPRAVTRPTPP